MEGLCSTYFHEYLIGCRYRKRKLKLFDRVEISRLTYSNRFDGRWQRHRA